MMTVYLSLAANFSIFFIYAFSINKIYCKQLLTEPNFDIETIKNDALKEYVSSYKANYDGWKTFTETNANSIPCSINIQKDLPKSNDPQPLYINPQTNDIWSPNVHGYLEIPKGSTIELYCSTSFDNSTTEDALPNIPRNLKVIKLTCISGTTFSWYGIKYQFRQFQCKKHQRYIVEQVNEKCGPTKNGTVKADLYRIGFNISGDRFIETMRICYDMNLMRNQYTYHRILPGSIHFQRYVNRLNFSKVGLFQNHNMNFYYTQKNQKQRAKELFENQTEIVTKIFGQDLFLARGHLAAKSDYIFANQQRTTFTFLNVAPQWQSFNSGQWASLEDAVRKFVMKKQIEVDCYTGTFDTLRLRPTNNSNVPAKAFFLAKDENNNDILPVPKFYYRVIITRNQPRRGIVLIGVNNPHTTLREIQESYIICENIDNVSWLRWIRNNNLKKGYVYACTVEEFLNVVNILPQHLKGNYDLLT